MEKIRHDKRFWLALVIFSLTGQVAWTVENMYFNVFIYKMFHASASDISLMVAASAVAATVTTLLIGALSDKVGKRKIFICGGYILWGITIWSFSLIRMDVINVLFPAVASAAAVTEAATSAPSRHSMSAVKPPRRVMPVIFPLRKRSGRAGSRQIRPL